MELTKFRITDSGSACAWTETRLQDTYICRDAARWPGYVRSLPLIWIHHH